MTKRLLNTGASVSSSWYTMSKFVIPGRLPGLNEYTASQRGNRYKGASMKKEWQRVVCWSIRAAKLKPIKNPVRLVYTFYEPDRRRDMDNISGFAHKVIQDALVATGILQGDGWKHITGYTDIFAVDKKNPRIEVELIEVGR